MARALKVCSVPSCPRLTQHGKCAEHQRQADQARGTAAARGYTSTGHKRFRAEVLRRDPTCVLCHAAPATVADHWPTSRRELAAGGLNPNDPRHGRGLCGRCHNQATARHQPGGWNA